METAVEIPELSLPNFEEFLRAVFAPSPIGTRRMMIFQERQWRWNSGVEGTLEIWDGEKWRRPTEEENKIIGEFIDALHQEETTKR
jgi:hypothetical protein